jgi:hypothetical protein
MSSKHLTNCVKSKGQKYFHLKITNMIKSLIWRSTMTNKVNMGTCVITGSSIFPNFYSINILLNTETRRKIVMLFMSYFTFKPCDGLKLRQSMEKETK